MYGGNEIVRRPAIQRNFEDGPMAPLKPYNSGSAPKLKIPSWLRIVGKCSLFLVVLISSLDTIRRIVPSSSHGMENRGVSVPEMENFVNSVVKRMQVQLENSVEMKVEESIALVMNEIEKHAADGLGMVDYLGGGMVVEHSETKDADGRIKISSKAMKMLSPSFGEPGQCFPLKGGSGFVVIALTKAIVPKSVTLEHVAKSVAYDRYSAPKHCRVSGWLTGEDRINLKIGSKKFILAEFTYDLEKSNVQTYKVVELPDSPSSLVNTVRLDFASNYGSLYTCIYRLRVHGHEPLFAPM